MRREGESALVLVGRAHAADRPAALAGHLRHRLARRRGGGGEHRLGGHRRRDTGRGLAGALVEEARALEALVERQRRIFRRRPAIGGLDVAAVERRIFRQRAIAEMAAAGRGAAWRGRAGRRAAAGGGRGGIAGSAGTTRSLS